MNVKLCLLLIFLPWAAVAQGFSGLGSQADGFAVPAPNPQFDFPADHAAHPDYRIEWWYLTANLQDAAGQAYGLQWTLFRTALAPGDEVGWGSPQVWFAHAAVTTPHRHFATERFARGGIGQAGVQAAPFRAWIDEWSLAGPNFDHLTVQAQGPDFAYDMQLTAQGPLVFHGQQGFSVKSAQGQASYYYSQPFFDIAGQLVLPDGPVQVTGQAWLDREWSSQPLADSQTGWDWFSLAFDSGDKMMGFQLRDTRGGTFSSATWITADGTTTPFVDGAFVADPLDSHTVAGRDVPVRWRVQLPAKGVDVTVQALNPDAWMDLSIPYWEGPVLVDGSHTGQGYLEMTGYD